MKADISDGKIILLYYGGNIITEKEGKKIKKWWGGSAGKETAGFDWRYVVKIIKTPETVDKFTGNFYPVLFHGDTQVWIDNVQIKDLGPADQDKVPLSQPTATPTFFKLRVGIFNGQGIPGKNGARLISWYQDELKKLGLEAIELKVKDLIDPEHLNRKVLDVLILPDGKNIPYESAYLIPKFLSEGGHLILTYLPVAGYKNNSGQVRKIYTDPFARGGNPDYQLRFLRWKSAQRSLNTELKINPVLPAAIKAELPPVAIPLKRTFGLPDKYNMFRNTYVNGNRESRDLDCGGGSNVETAGNIILPVYRLPSGEPTDFLAYRYHNKYYNGSTLIHLGKVGERLMESDKAGNVLKACLQLCLETYPGEQTAEWYERLLKVQQKVSEFGGDFVDAYYGIRDKMMATFYTGNKGYILEKKMQALLNGLGTIIQGKQNLDTLLLSGAASQIQDQRRKVLLKKLNEEKHKCRQALTMDGKFMLPIKEPEKVKIQNPLGSLPVGATNNVVGVYGFRTRMPAIKKWGINTLKNRGFYCLFHNYFPKGLHLNVTGVWGGSSMFPLPRQGKLDIMTGKVKETRWDKYEPKKLRNYVKKKVRLYSDCPVIRYTGGDEGGLYNGYWGEQARQEYIGHLKKKYRELNKLNARWQTKYTDFADIRLITRQPETIQEHANWEDWSKFREMQLFNARNTVYKLFKQYAPDVFYSAYISTGCRYHPTYGVNYYELTKVQDISGIDGTAISVPQEWTYLDLVADNKKIWTLEWGAFYYPPADKLAGREHLRKQLWQEVSGGHIGINLWIWSIPGFQGNYIDMTGLPTQYGWELKQLVSDFRKFEHVLLDGKRLEPEIRILFSNTSRSHDQPWVAWGKHPFSPHLTAVDVLYGSFAKFKFPVRVLDEGALNDGANLSKCKQLIVPQAQYLSCKVRNKLLEYAQNGGCLIITGLTGKYDNYGNDSDTLLKALGIVPGTVKTKELQLLNCKVCDTRYQDMAYAPITVGNSRTLAVYKSGEPAVIGMNLGKGKVFVVGLPLSALDLQGINTVMGKIFKAVNYMPKYRCNDKSLILREWEYGGELYLICAYPSGKNMVNQFDLSIRGNWEVKDYLLGIKLPVKQEKGYSCFKGIILSPGGRVYRLKPKNSSGLAKHGDSTQSVTSSVGKNSNQIVQEKKNGKSLPYHGKLQEQNGEVELGGYKFSIAVVVEKYSQKGQVFLTVRKGDEKQKRELKVRKPAVFVFKDRAVRVKCKYPIYNYPEGAVVTIEETAKPELKLKCKIITDGTAKILTNGMLSLKILPDVGGKVSELRNYPEDVNHIGPDGITEVDGRFPGHLSSKEFTVESEKATGEACSLIMTMKNVTPNGLQVKKTFSMEKRTAKINIRIELINDGNTAWNGSFRIHPELNISGIADRNDLFYIPIKNGLETVPYVPGGGSQTVKPIAGWVACCDRRERQAYISTFSLNDVNEIYMYMGDNFYSLELMDKKVQLKKGERLSFNHEISLIRGLSGIGGYARGVGWQSDRTSQKMVAKREDECGF